MNQNTTDRQHYRTGRIQWHAMPRLAESVPELRSWARDKIRHTRITQYTVTVYLLSVTLQAPFYSSLPMQASIADCLDRRQTYTTSVADLRVSKTVLFSSRLSYSFYEKFLVGVIFSVACTDISRSVKFHKSTSTGSWVISSVKNSRCMPGILEYYVA